MTTINDKKSETLRNGGSELEQVNGEEHFKSGEGSE